MALAVPLSSNFAGEFLVLAGVFQAGWGYAVVGAVAIVLAAMYMLRLISAVLHQEVGPAVSDAALDLRGAELAIARAAGRDPALPLGLAERDHRALVRRRLATADAARLRRAPSRLGDGWTCYAPPC